MAILMKNKTILIFGGTGALGKTLIKRYYNKNKIIVFSRDEHKHVDLMKEYSEIESHLGEIVLVNSNQMLLLIQQHLNMFLYVKLIQLKV